MLNKEILATADFPVTALQHVQKLTCQPVAGDQQSPAHLCNTNTLASTTTIMTTQRQPAVAQKEGRILLASQAINVNRIKSVRRAAELFDVPRSLLRRRLQGCQPPSTINARKRRLLNTEKQSLIQWILEHD